MLLTCADGAHVRVWCAQYARAHVPTCWPQADVHVHEWQMRGLIHAHLIVWFAPEHRMRQPEDFDQVVRAEIPDPETEPALHAAVVRHMLHTRCDGPPPPAGHRCTDERTQR